MLRLFAICLVAAAFGAAASDRAFADTTQLAVQANVAQGSTAQVDLSASALSGVASVDRIVGSAVASRGISISLDRFPQLQVDVPSMAKLGAAVAEIDGTGCSGGGSSGIASSCGEKFVLHLTLNVVAPGAAAASAAPLDVADPSSDRLAQAVPLAGGAGLELTDEVWVVLGSPDHPGSRADAIDIASSVGGYVVGGIDDLGVFQIRWPTSQDINARMSQLAANPAVASVSPADTVASIETRVPSDWNDDGPVGTWPMTLIHAPQAWDQTTGSNIKVGIVDGDSVMSWHEDLNVVKVLNPGPLLDQHATHVAGLACAVANGIGLVGAAWGCPIVSNQVGSAAWGTLVLRVLQRMNETAKQGPRVVNLSLGFNLTTTRCGTAQDQSALAGTVGLDAPMFKQLYESSLGRGIVWTIAAGNNCLSGVDSPWGIAGAAEPNVLTVAAVNSDGNLAGFSNFGPGVKVAAPGGWSVAPVGNGTQGVWSTWFTNCGSACRAPTYASDEGTSMAAPIVAGVAALVASAHPSFSAAQVANCITSTAGVGTGVANQRDPTPLRRGWRSPSVPFQGGLGIVNADAAVRCAPPPPPSSSTIGLQASATYATNPGFFLGAGGCLDGIALHKANAPWASSSSYEYGTSLITAGGDWVPAGSTDFPWDDAGFLYHNDELRWVSLSMLLRNPAGATEQMQINTQFSNGCPALGPLPTAVPVPYPAQWRTIRDGSTAENGCGTLAVEALGGDRYRITARLGVLFYANGFRCGFQF